MSQLFQELKRRNVFRVAIAYLALAWLIMQIADVVLGNTEAPGWIFQVLLLFLGIGFPLAIFFAWAYELTPEGLKREHEVDREKSITHETGRKLNQAITLVLGAAVVILLADRFLFENGGPAPATGTTDKSVAVLPFVAMSSGADDDFFADGLTEEILNSLTRLPELLVTARTSAFHFKGKDIPIPEIAATLGVAHVVEGSVRRSGERLRVTAQLIRAGDGFHLWSETYDRDTSDTFGVQTDIAEKIATALDVVLDDDQLARMQSRGIRDPEAFVALQKGIEAYRRAHAENNSTSILNEANRWFEKSIALHPGQAGVYTMHADLFVHRLIQASVGEDMTDDELAAAIAGFTSDMDNAIRFATDEPSQLSARFDKKVILGQWRGLPALFDRMRANDGCVWGAWFEVVSAPYGRAQDLLDIAQRATECDPLNFGTWRAAIWGHAWSGNYEAAVDIGYKGLASIRHPSLETEQILALTGAGRFEEAETLIDRDFTDDGIAMDLRIRVAAARGESDRALDLLADFMTTARSAERRAIISLLAVTGRRDEANKLAADVDKRQFGYLLLMQIPVDCQCGAPWDIEVTPNFARLIDAADLPWPPASPATWPLKDW